MREGNQVENNEFAIKRKSSLKPDKRKRDNSEVKIHAAFSIFQFMINFAFDYPSVYVNTSVFQGLWLYRGLPLFINPKLGSN